MRPNNHVERWKCEDHPDSGGGHCTACDSEWDCPECEAEDDARLRHVAEAALRLYDAPGAAREAALRDLFRAVCEYPAPRGGKR